MNRKTAGLISSIVLCDLLIIGGLVDHLQQQREALKEVKRESALEHDRGYEQGFGEGVKATLKHTTFDTNTGKFTLELTNVFKEMKL